MTQQLVDGCLRLLIKVKSLTMWSFSFLFFVFEKEIKIIAIVVLCGCEFMLMRLSYPGWLHGPISPALATSSSFQMAGRRKEKG